MPRRRTGPRRSRASVRPRSGRSSAPRSAAGSPGRRCRSGRRASPAGSRACRAAAWCRRVPSPVSCHAMLLVYGPRSASYDFGPGHPLTPRRFGPGIELLRAVGAEPGLAPEPAPDDELLWSHSRRYIDAVKRFSVDPFGWPEAGIGEGGDDPPFAGMHEAGAMVAGGSIRAVEAVLRGDVEHAFHPGGGLHHAMPDRASGFCIYDDPALAIARARRDGLRVLYVDLDVHHGDGVQAIHWSDPGVLTLSFHESGRYLFPGTGGVGELGEGAAAGHVRQRATGAGDGRGGVARGGPGAAPRIGRRVRAGPDRVAARRRHARVGSARAPAGDDDRDGRGGSPGRSGGARARRRSMAGDRWRRLRRVPGRATELEPRLARRCASRGPGRDARRSGASAGRPRLRATARRHSPRRSRMPRTRASRWTRRRPWPRPGRSRRSGSCGGSSCHGSCRSRGIAAGGIRWRRLRHVGPGGAAPSPGRQRPEIIHPDAATWERLSLAPRVVAPSDPAAGHALIRAAIADGANVTAAVEGTIVVGLAIAGPTDEDGRRELLALGVAPSFRRQGLGTALLEACVTADGPAPRDTRPTSPSPNAIRSNPSIERFAPHIAGRLLEGAGFRIQSADPALRGADPAALRAVRSAT